MENHNPDDYYHHHHHCSNPNHQHVCCHNQHHVIQHHPYCNHHHHHNLNDSYHHDIRQMENSSPEIIAYDVNDDDRATIISTENINKLSVVQLNRNSGRDSRFKESPAVSSNFVCRWVSAVGVIDLLLFATSIILALVTESHVCHDGPVVLSRFTEVFEYEPEPSSPSSSIGFAGGFEGKTGVVPLRLHSSESSNTVYEYVKSRVFEDYRVNSPLLYHLCVIGLLAAGTGYFVLEVWLFCVLVKIGKNPRISACIKWLSYRSIILTILLLITLHDVTFTYQAECSEIVLVPMYVVRSFIAGVPVTWILLNGITKW